MRKQPAGDSIIFETENIIEETNNGDINYYKVTNELNDFNRNGRSNDDGRSTKRTVQQLFIRHYKTKTSQQTNKIFCKIITPLKQKVILKLYSATGIKARNFLSNIAYNSVNDQDIFDRNFCFDTYVLLTKNLSPFSSVRKIIDQSKHEAIHMLWNDCMPNEFFKFICKHENFNFLNGKNVPHPKIADIV